MFSDILQKSLNFGSNFSSVVLKWKLVNTSFVMLAFGSI